MSKKQQDLFQTKPPPWELDEQDDWVAARVVFSAPPFGPYDYLVPPKWVNRIQCGSRVRVPLGRSDRKMEGYCLELVRATDEAASTINVSRLKSVSELVDDRSLISAELIELANWISKYYVCELGPTIEAVIPPGVRDKSGTREIVFLSVSPQYLAAPESFPITVTQRRVVETLLEAGQPLTTNELAQSAGCTNGPIALLRKKGLIVSTAQRIWQKDHHVPNELRELGFRLNKDQRSALEKIETAIAKQKHETFLIHGITGSGKTEVYIKAIEQVISFGRQAIVLVPEISLTPQTRQRFRARFDRIAVLHSHMSRGERAWHWKEIADGQVQVVIGARSAVFAPVPQLGLIVIDEEHDASFKQDSAPRYHARDVALWRAGYRKVPLLLGSATPALESWYAASRSSESWTKLSLPTRVLDRPLPHVGTIDLRTEFSSRQSRGAVSRQLHAAIRQSIDDGGQVMLLLNRRGFSTSIQCPSCGHVVHCPDCSIPMTHHRDGHKAVCHYCDHQTPEPRQCPECGYCDISFMGFGTQKLEAEIKRRFPDAPCKRMDTDTMQRAGSHEKALEDFRGGKTKILLGTQMIAKGLDFPNVTLVGVINADTALHFPDFRAAERTFQLVTQVAGRSGRGEKGGRVLVQTFSPEHPAIMAASKHDFEKFAKFELKQREQYGYPPFGKFARALVRGESETLVEQFAERLAKEIEIAAQKLGVEMEILGPAPAPMEKLRGKFRYHCLVQSPKKRDANCAAQASVQTVFSNVRHGLECPEEIQWIVDVDPQDML